MRVLSVTHGPTVPGGLFDDAVEAGGHALERWLVPEGGSPDRASRYDAVMVFGGSQHPDQDDRFGWLGREEEFLREVLAGRPEIKPKRRAPAKRTPKKKAIAATR